MSTGAGPVTCCLCNLRFRSLTDSQGWVKRWKSVSRQAYEPDGVSVTKKWDEVRLFGHGWAGTRFVEGKNVGLMTMACAVRVRRIRVNRERVEVRGGLASFDFLHQF